LIRSASRSTPRFMSFNEAKNSGDLSALTRASKQVLSAVKMVFRDVIIAPSLEVMGGNSVNSRYVGCLV